MAWSEGPLIGTTLTIAVSPVWLTTGGATKATPGRVPTSVMIASAAASASSTPRRSTATTSGPLKPGPKAALTCSYAACWVEPEGALLSLGMPRRRSPAGIASASREARPR